MAKKKAAKEEKGEEAAAPAPGAADSQECLLEEELKKERIEEKYRETREQINELRKKHDDVKQKTADMHQESREFANYIEARREKRHQQVVSINDDQTKQLKDLDLEEARLQAEHEAEINRINGLIRDEDFKRIKLQDELQQMADLVLLKEQNDRKIQEQYEKMQIADAEMLQEMKIECLKKQKEHQAFAVSTSKEEQQKLNIEAKKMVVERTTAAKRENQDLRRRLTELIEEGKSIAKERKELEEQQRKIRAEVDYLKSIKKRKVPFELPKTSLSDRPPFRY